MGTSTSEIVDLFLSGVSDYKLDAIYNASGSLVLNQSVEPWLLKGIADFTPISTQDLTYTAISGSSDGYFAETLTMENQIILALHMELYWLQKGIQDFRALVNPFGDRDFRPFSPAQNITARTANYNAKREELSQRLMDYSYAHKSDWDQWRNQIFST